MYQEVCFNRGTEAGGGVNVGHSLSPPSHFMLATGLLPNNIICSIVHTMIVQSKNYWNWKRGLNISGFTAKFVVLHCTFCTLHLGIWGFSAPPSIKQNRTKTKTKTELRAGQRKSWWCVECLPTEGGRHCSFASDKNKKGQKNIWSKLVDYGLKWSQATNLETQKQNKQSKILQSQIKNHDLVNLSK